MVKFPKVGIVGVGFIGGSIALILKKKKICRYVIGIGRRQKSLKEAVKKGVIDKASLDIKEIRDCDLIILATPVGTIIKSLSGILKIARKGSVVMDVGSTKLEVMNSLKKHALKTVDFIGAHPLAGSEKRGVAFASAGLFKDSLCLITPSSNTKKNNLDKIVALWKALGAKVEIISPKRHDRVIALTSHLPHFIAFCLMRCLSKNLARYASGGLRDTTRIASSDHKLWTDIFLTNKTNLFNAVSDFQRYLEKLKLLVKKNDSKGLSRFLKRSKQKRDGLES